MSWKEVFSQLVEHVLGNSVILMILTLGAIAVYAMYVKIGDPGATKEIVGNAISAIAGAAGGAGITAAIMNRRNGANPPAPPTAGEGK